MCSNNNRCSFLAAAAVLSSLFFGNFICHAAPVEKNFFWADPLETPPSDPNFVDTYPNITMKVGDTVEFTYSPIHNVYIHPTDNCSRAGSIKVGGALDSPASYTFTADQIGKEIFFACDRGLHCEDGQNLIVTVIAAADDDVDDADVPVTTTLAPTPSPTFTLGDGGGDFAVCFAGDTIVDVMDHGATKIENLELGDMVNIGDNKYSKVYSFGHKESSVRTEYVQIHYSTESTTTTKPLKLSKNHMIFVVAEEDAIKAVPASVVKPGDNLIFTTNGERATVTKISTTWGIGAFAPFTVSGTIAVNGILASNYVSLQQNNEGDTLMIGTNWKTSISMQWLSHAFQAHHRLVCQTAAHFCNEETYTQNGISHWVYRPMVFFRWILSQPQWAIALVVPFIAGTAVCLSSIEFIMTQQKNSLLLLLVVLLPIFLVGGRRRIKQ